MLEFLRGDTPRYWLDWTAAQWTSMVVMILSLILMGVFYIKSNPKGGAEGKSG